VNPCEHDKKLDELVTGAISRAGVKFDFDKWKQDHQNQVREFERQAKTRRGTTSAGSDIWRRIMVARASKIAAVLIIAIGIVGIIAVFHGSSGVAFADVVKNVQNARTLTFLQTGGRESGVTHIMVMVPHLMRVELPDGRIVIIDSSKEKAIVFDTKNKLFRPTICDFEENSNLYNSFRYFWDRPGFSTEKIGQRKIGGKSAIGFLLKAEEANEQRGIAAWQEMTVWVDAETKLPIRMEGAVQGNEGAMQVVVTDIVFDSELDESLFSLGVPPEYKKKAGSDIGSAKWTEGKAMMGTIATAIRAWRAEKNPDGSWDSNSLTFSDLGFLQGDLTGTYFDESNFSWVVNCKRTTGELLYTIKATAGIGSTAPVQVTLNQDGKFSESNSVDQK